MKSNNRALWIGGAVALVAVLLACGAFRHDKTLRTISVNGECLTTAPKDRTAITLRVTTLDKSAARSMRMATDKMAEITAFVKDLDAEMQTTQFNSYEKTEWNHTTQKSESLGIETTIAVEISSESMDTIEQVLNKFAGMDNVFPENLRMFTSTRALQPILQDCMATAVENARTRANALAAGDHRRAGRILSLSYGSGASVYERPVANFLQTKMMATAEAVMDTAGSIVSKDTEVSVSVSAVFEIK